VGANAISHPAGLGQHGGVVALGPGGASRPLVEGFWECIAPTLRSRSAATRLAHARRRRRERSEWADAESTRRPPGGNGLPANVSLLGFGPCSAHPRSLVVMPADSIGISGRVAVHGSSYQLVQALVIRFAIASLPESSNIT